MLRKMLVRSSLRQFLASLRTCIGTGVEDTFLHKGHAIDVGSTTMALLKAYITVAPRRSIVQRGSAEVGQAGKLLLWLMVECQTSVLAQ
jgi:hypothetical protein